MRNSAHTPESHAVAYRRPRRTNSVCSEKRNELERFSDSKGMKLARPASDAGWTRFEQTVFDLSSSRRTSGCRKKIELQRSESWKLLLTGQGVRTYNPKRRNEGKRKRPPKRTSRKPLSSSQIESYTSPKSLSIVSRETDTVLVT